jgi:butyrate kinase
MGNKDYILVINPGSTSTKIALYSEKQCLAVSNLSHSLDDIKKYEKIYDQKDMRTNVILIGLKNRG